eukprot:g4986.t1
MAYNLYQAQMAKAWVQRVEKEQLLADRFWSNYTTNNETKNPGMEQLMKGNLKDIETCSSIAPTYVSDTASTAIDTEVFQSLFFESFNDEDAYFAMEVDFNQCEYEQLLKNRLELLEQELLKERQKRVEIEEDLNRLKSTFEDKISH